MSNSHSLKKKKKKRSEFIFFRLVTCFIKKIPKNPPLFASPKFSSPSQKISISLLSKILISCYQKSPISIGTTFFSPQLLLSPLKNFFPILELCNSTGTTLSLSLLFFAISKVCWCPLCAFENKLRMIEQETLFVIEQAVLKL